VILAQPVRPAGLSQRVVLDDKIALRGADLTAARASLTHTTGMLRQLEKAWDPAQTQYSIESATKYVTVALNLASLINRQITHMVEDQITQIVSPQLEALRADIQSELIKKIQPQAHLIAAARQRNFPYGNAMVTLPDLRRNVLGFMRVLEGVQQNLVYLIEEKPEVASMIMVSMFFIAESVQSAITVLIELAKAGADVAKKIFEWLPWVLGGVIVVGVGAWALKRRKDRE
jgi:hypothetical protein